MRAAALAVVLAGPGAVPAPAQDAVEAGRLYETDCATCHGRQGQEAARGQARRLDSLNAAQVHAYLQSRQGMERPQRPYERIKAALSDAEIDALSAHIAGFRRP